jgi:hypothetical protein
MVVSYQMMLATNPPWTRLTDARRELVETDRCHAASREQAPPVAP